MLLFRGGAAATPFKLQQQLQSVQNISPRLTELHADWVYFIEHCGVLKSEQIGLLRTLLNVQEAFSKNYKLSEEFIVSPRFGTISPWSSKACDIINQCGLNAAGRMERGVLFKLAGWSDLTEQEQQSVSLLLHDRMTQTVINQIDEVPKLFEQHEPRPLMRLPSIEELPKDIEQLNQQLGLALSGDEIGYLVDNYTELNRCPTDVELMMFAQANSEHCRHKIFNASWTIDGNKQDETLFGMIKTTHANAPENVLLAYHDNAAVIAGHKGKRFYPQAEDQGAYRYFDEDIHILMKVETHNHPTAISPYPGAATGSGGEIRDEGATGRGGYPKAGLCGFSVSNLQLPTLQEPWEVNYGQPARIVSALDIMIEGPLGAAAFNNEFGRPNLAGYFRTFEQAVNSQVRGYHKPIMIAGGMGNIRADDVNKKIIPPGTPIIVIGGPAMLIGLGGGAASSMASGNSDAQLDFASVQRENPEMERRCQEVINHCWSLQDKNPIVSIHDVGAGGLSNALPEILHDCGRGGHMQLRAIPNMEPGMSPLEIWCNEAQERYMLAVNQQQLEQFIQICERERCLYAVLGEATEEQELKVFDEHFNNLPIEMPMEVLLGKPPKITRETQQPDIPQHTYDYSSIDIAEAAKRVLRLPTVASKKFLITIGDRTITGMVTRDQMVGPWQVPVADVAVTASGYQAYTGEAMAMGERTPLALFSGKKSAKMAISESITNLLAANWKNTHDVRLSANWMAAANHEQEDAVLFDAVKAATELCRELKIAIPVGKDSLSMQTVWDEHGQDKSVVSPVSLIVTAFAPVTDVRDTWTPQICTDQGPSYLVLIDLGAKQNRLGGSCLSQVYQAADSRVPDLDSAKLLDNLIQYISELRNKSKVLSYHDRSDGGLFTTLCEMAFAGRCGFTVQLDSLGDDPLASLFSEELGCVLQIGADEIGQATLLAQENGLGEHFHILGEPQLNQKLIINYKGKLLINNTRANLEQEWSQTSLHIQQMRDNAHCAKQEFSLISDNEHRGLIQELTYDVEDNIHINSKLRPKIAILREQGVNGHMEMAAAFDRAGFEATDVHMTDLINDRVSLNDFSMLAACGGFSYGDVLGAGSGWAANILYNSKLNDIFQAFFERNDSLVLGVCNGCQMLSQLTSIIPGAAHWPRFVHNESEQFEARLVNVKITDSPSILLNDMSGSVLPVAVAHGEGKISLSEHDLNNLSHEKLVAMQYVNSQAEVTEKYPLNPNGSAQGITAVTNLDGRVTIMMPHPERLFRSVQYSWLPDTQRENGPWFKMFANARRALD